MKLKFALLGCWHSHAVMHVREAAARPEEFELLGMYDPDPEVITSNQRNWAEYGLPLPVFPTVEAVLASGVQAVVVEGHVYQNLDYAEAALQAGLHVLLEKPAGVDLQRFARLQDLAAASRLQLHLAYMWRYNAALRELRRLVAADALGQIFQFRGHIPKPIAWHPELATEFSLYHGGVYFEMAGHLVDLMVALMGEPLRVHPALASHYGDRTLIDNAVVVHECQDGLATIDTTAMQIGMDRRIEVHGTAGTALHEPLGSDGLRLYLADPVGDLVAGEWLTADRPASDDGVTLLRELAACIRGDKAPEFSAAHDLAVQRTLLTGCGIKDGNALRSPPQKR
ncbi:MAG: Gfo/Idh/MocA family oxidoreductase [Gemmatimonadetes bacterium]|jgi:predicted dehydrogenase|nr:Gfo/Idh/MocA family oxidoreductase [Gemmatimonadota bacterium]